MRQLSSKWTALRFCNFEDAYEFQDLIRDLIVKPVEVETQTRVNHWKVRMAENDLACIARV